MQQVTAGARHTLTLAGDGGVWVWGNNDEGQLGDGGFERFRGDVQPAIDATLTGLLDLDLSAANAESCPLVVGATKSGSIAALSAGFRLYVAPMLHAPRVPVRRAPGATGSMST